MRGLAFTP